MSIANTLEDIAKQGDISHLPIETQVEELTERNLTLAFLVNQMAIEHAETKAQNEAYERMLPMLESSIKEVQKLYELLTITEEETDDVHTEGLNG